MTYTQKQMEQLAKIMDVEEEMIPLLRYIRPANQVLNGLGQHLPDALESLGIEKGVVILDAPCGQGGVSIALAERYGVRVVGYDIVPDYIDFAKDLAAKKRVSHLCDFRIGDIEDIVKQKNICDLLLWVAPPHIFGRAKSTIEALRNTVKNNGLIVIGDAYLLPGVKASSSLENYESLEETTRGYTAFGDKVIGFHDYGDALWEEDYIFTRRMYKEALGKVEKAEEGAALQRFIDSLDGKEREDRENLGVAIWIVRVDVSTL